MKWADRVCFVMLGALFVPVPRRELEHIAETMQEQKKNGKRERRVEGK